MALSTYPNNPAALRAIGLRSTTQRLALNPASLLMACASSPRMQMGAVKPNSSKARRTSGKS